MNTGATLTLSNPAADNSTLSGNITLGSHNTTTTVLLLGANDQISDTAAITFNSGTVSGQSSFLRLAGFNETVGSVSTAASPFGTASVIENLSATTPSVFTIGGSATTTFDGIIRNGAVGPGTLGITLAGTTNLTLTNTANVAGINYTGTTAIGAGTTLNMYDGNGGTIASFASPITNSGTLSLTNTNVANTVIAVNRTLAQPISGGGTLNINAGLSSITLSGANVHTGTTNINSGTLIVTNAGAQALPGQITGAGGLSQTGAGAVTVSNVTNSYGGPTSITAGPLIFQNHSLPSGSAVTVGAAGTLSILDDGSGSGGIIAYGNTFSPSSATSNLNVANNGSLNSGNTVAFGNFLVNGATLSTTTFTGANLYKVSFAGITLPGGTGNTTTLTPTTTSVSILGDVTNPMVNYGNGSFDTLALDGTSTGNIITGNISEAVGGSFANPLLGGYTRIIKQNTSTWTLSGSANSYSGITQVNGGTLVSGASNVIPLANLQGIQVSALAASNSTWDLGTNSQTLNTLGGIGTAINLAGAGTAGGPIITGGAGSVLTVNGNVTYNATNNPLGGVISVGTLDLGGGNRTFTINDSTSAAIDTQITSLVQNGTLTKAGAGVLQLTQVPTANVVLSAGTLDLGGNTITTLTLNGGTVQNGVISGAAFLKNGPGTLTLAASASTTGVTSVVVNQGLLGITANPATASLVAANFANAGATNIFAPGATLTLGGSATSLVGGGGVSFTGFAAGTNSQTFASTLIDAGANAIGGTIGGTVAVNLGPVTRNVGGTVDFTIPAGPQSATNGIIVGGSPTGGTLVTSATGAAYATAGGNDWAANSTVSANNIVSAAVAGAASASIYTTATNAATFTGNANVTVAALAATAGSTVNSIRFNTAATAQTLTLSGVNTITTGGILIGNTTSGIITIAGGTIQPGAGVGELALIVNKPNTGEIISSVIADNGATPTAVTFRGNPNGGTTGSILGLAANNIYTGPTYVTSGRLQVVTAGINTPFGTGSNAIVYVDGNADGQVYIAQNVTIANPFVVIGTGFNEVGIRRGALRLDSTAVITPTLSGPITLMGDTTIFNNAAITGAGFAAITGSIGTSVAAGSSSFTLTKAGTGVIKLSGTNSQTNTNLTAGALNVNADAALGIAGAPITFNAGSLQYQNSFLIDNTRPVVLTGAGTIDTGLLGITSTTLSNVISGAGAFTKGYATPATNSAPLVLTGDNTFTGAVTINHGWLTATTSTSLGLGAKVINIVNGTAGDPQLHLNPGAGPGIDLPANMTFTTSSNLGAVTNDSGNNIIRGAFSLTSGGGGTTLLSNAGSLTLTGGIAPIQTGRDFRLRGDGAGAISGIIANGTTVDLPVFRDGGSGTWTLSGANSYTGTTFVSTGTLKLGNPAALGALNTGLATSDNGTNVTVGGALDLGGVSNLNEIIRIADTGVSGTGALTNTGASASIGSSLAGLKASATTGITVTGATSVSLTGGGAGTGATATASIGVTAASFTITGGTTVYSVAPTVTIAGGTGATATATLTAGVVSGITITAPGTGFAGVPTITFTAGTVTTAGTNPSGAGNNTNFVLNNVAITGVGSGYTAPLVATLVNATGATLTANLAGVVMTGDSTIGGSGNITLNSVISEAGGSRALTKVGTNALTLNNAATYTGATNVNNGTLNVNGVLGSGSNIVNANAGNTNFGVSETLGALNIADGAVVTLGAPAFAAPFESNAVNSLAVQGVPEPGAATLLFGGLLTLLGMRRRR